MGWSDFVKEQFIGKGSYGKVYRVKRRSDGKTYALKEGNIKCTPPFPPSPPRALP